MNHFQVTIKGIKVFLILFLFSTHISNSQTFIGNGAFITDAGTTTINLNVTGLPAAIDTSFGLETVCLNIAHSRAGDLFIYLIAPDGTAIELTTGNGGTDNNYDGTCFDDASQNYIQNGSAPFTGIYHPEGLISFVNNGQSGNGVWQLKIIDAYFSGLGLLNSWYITFGNNPPEPFSSNLPIVKLFTNGQEIVDDPKILINMEIIDNGPGNRNYYSDQANAYDGYAGIELRGSSSQSFPKKGYGFETTDSLMNEIDVSLLGMPAENDWILNANYTDKTFIRNVLAYQISNQMGHYAPRYRYCELFRDGQYRGIYILSEKIKRDNNRVNIAKLTPADTIGDDLTGGYIVKIDKSTGSGGDGWQSSFAPVNGGQNPFFMYEYPDPDDILPVQKNYIQNFIDSFEIVLSSPLFTNPVTGYRSYINTGSFIDYFLVNEISKNVDGYRISTFMYKDKNSNGGLLNAGPVWDYDIAWGNADYYNGSNFTGWSYQFNYTSDPWQVPFIWSRFLMDPSYTAELRCRWDSLRQTILATNTILNQIDSIAFLLNEAQQRNFRRWPILGVYVWPNPSPLPADYPGVINELKNFITNRLNHLDQVMPGICNTSLNENLSNNIRVYPNPSSDFVIIEQLNPSQHNPLKLEVFSIDGKLLLQKEITENRIRLEQMPSGMYLFRFFDQQNIWSKKVVFR